MKKNKYPKFLQIIALTLFFAVILTFASMFFYNVKETFYAPTNDVRTSYGWPFPMPVSLGEGFDSGMNVRIYNIVITSLAFLMSFIPNVAVWSIPGIALAFLIVKVKNRTKSE